MRRAAAATAFVAAVLAAGSAAAQPAADAALRSEEPAPAPAAAATTEGGQAEPSPFDDELRRVLVEHRDQRRREGFALLAGGVAAAAAGVALVAADPDDEALVAAGTTSLGFGVVDILLPLGRLDMGGETRRLAARGRLPGSDAEGFDAVRDEAARRELRGGQIFAVNAGLDLLYVGAGLLAYFLGRAKDPDVRWLQGTALATAANGVYLLGFDLAAWIGSNRRAETLLSLGR